MAMADWFNGQALHCARTRSQHRIQRPLRQLQFLLAAENGNITALDNLLAESDVNGIDINGLTNGSEETALQIATSEGHHHVVEYLLKRGCDLNHRDAECRAALMVASGSRNYYRIVEMLIQAGADVNTRSMFGTLTFIKNKISINNSHLIYIDIT